MICYGCWRERELLCTDWVCIFKQHSVNKIAFSANKLGTYALPGSRQIRICIMCRKPQGSWVTNKQIHVPIHSHTNTQLCILVKVKFTILVQVYFVYSLSVTMCVCRILITTYLLTYYYYWYLQYKKLVNIFGECIHVSWNTHYSR